MWALDVVSYREHKDEETKINIEIRYVVAQDGRMADID